MVERFSISEFSTSRWSFFQDVIRYASLGINQMGLWRSKVSDFGEVAAIDLLYEMKMDVSSVHWVGGFTGSDGRSFVEAVEDGFEAIHLASRVNADCVILHPGSRNGHTLRHAQRLVTSAIQTLAPLAEDFGVKIAIEPMPKRAGNPWTFQSIQDSLRLAEMFPSTQVGLVLDLFHVGQSRTILDRLDEISDRICLVQIADRKDPFASQQAKHFQREQRLVPGEGIVEVDRWLKSLASAGYNGPLEFELHGPRFDNCEYFETLHQVVDLMGELALPKPATEKAKQNSRLESLN